MVSDKADEILEKLWNLIIEKKQNSVKLNILGTIVDSSEIQELLKFKMITLSADEIKLTKVGTIESQDIIRRHRLAERLLTDVLDIKGELIHESACQFEHILHKGISENICRLLGHPKVCPHGNAIPQGKCCIEKTKEKKGIRLISPLSQLNVGESGKIAYIQAGDQSKLQKMMAMGVLPGMEISLLQNFPSYLFKVGNSQFAVDETIANEIFVRIEKER